MFEKNAATRKKLTASSSRQQQIIETLRKKSEADESQLMQQTADGVKTIAAADQGKRESKKGNDQKNANSKAELAGVEKRLKDENELLSVLEHHKHVLMGEWSSQIENLSQTIKDLEEDFRVELSGLERQFRMSTMRFEGHIDLKMAKTKRDASNAALTHQPAVDKIAYSDNGWLRHEIGEQQVELGRARDVVADLQAEHVQLMESFYGRASPQANRAATARTAAQHLESMTLSGSESPDKSMRRTNSWKAQSRPNTQQGGSRPTTQQGSRPNTSPARPMSRGGPRIKSGFRATLTMARDELEALEQPKTGSQIMGGLRVFPAMAGSGASARIVGMRKSKQEEVSSLFPLPQVPQRATPSLSVM
jgi:hypothetical protein